MVLTMIIAFFVCWLPYTALSVVVVLNPELYIPPLLATMPMYFAKTSPIYNPVIYFLTNKQVGARQRLGHSTPAWSSSHVLCLHSTTVP